MVLSRDFCFSLILSKRSIACWHLLFAVSSIILATVTLCLLRGVLDSAASNFDVASFNSSSAAFKSALAFVSCSFKSSSFLARDSFFSISLSLSFCALSGIFFLCLASSLFFSSSSFSFSTHSLYAAWADLTAFLRSCVTGIFSGQLQTGLKNLTTSFITWRPTIVFSLRDALS